MEIAEYKFKTNINCNGCIAKVTPFLNDAEGTKEWNVDTTQKDKILTVKVDGININDIIATINKAGFKAESTN